jgi:hypothetical protein
VRVSFQGIEDSGQMNHLFSLQIESMGEDTVYKVEERKHPHQSPLDFINDVFNPVEKVEKLNQRSDKNKNNLRMQ